MQFKTTFKNRETVLSADHSLFSEQFRTEPGRVKMWQAFLRKIKSEENIDFQEVVEEIKRRLNLTT